MSSQAPAIAFFGATGGITNAVLVNALRAGHQVIALVRTPSKLTNQLLAQSITQKTIEAQLTIIAGNALDVAAVKSTLTANRPSYLVPNIVSGLGGAPKLQFNMCKPLEFLTIDDVHICEKAANTLISALQEIYGSNPSLAQTKPKLTFVSTTGISNGPEDVPLGMQTFYHKGLAVPHKDKKEMEALYRAQMPAGGNPDAVFSGVIGMRPALLSGGTDADEGVGHEKLKAGTEPKPAVGAWMVSRADVGAWMWYNVVGNLESRKQWEGELISLCR